jgi:ribosomal protein S14
MAKARAIGTFAMLHSFPQPYPTITYMHERTNGCSVVNGEKKKSGLIRKYGLNMSRQAFREKAADMGWVKVSENGLASEIWCEADEVW